MSSVCWRAEPAIHARGSDCPAASTLAAVGATKRLSQTATRAPGLMHGCLVQCASCTRCGQHACWPAAQPILLLTACMPESATLPAAILLSVSRVTCLYSLASTSCTTSSPSFGSSAYLSPLTAAERARQAQAVSPATCAAADGARRAARRRCGTAAGETGTSCHQAGCSRSAPPRLCMQASFGGLLSVPWAHNNAAQASAGGSYKAQVSSAAVLCQFASS